MGQWRVGNGEPGRMSHPQFAPGQAGAAGRQHRPRAGGAGVCHHASLAAELAVGAVHQLIGIARVAGQEGLRLDGQGGAGVDLVWDAQGPGVWLWVHQTKAAEGSLAHTYIACMHHPPSPIPSPPSQKIIHHSALTSQEA